MRVENQELVKFVFGIILLPMLNERKTTLEYVENLESLMSFHQIKETIENSLLEFYVEGDGWRYDKIELALNRLKLKGFFNRFTKVQMKYFLK
mmetsp:Transcript_23184/g.22681  ORF Transcript_23184/g.22681 Transcript_23184/m.22681 type:complete len:93 (+) Transcript_23184:644-922(+)